MTAPRVLALILAGGHGSRMDVLTRERAKPTLPFGGAFTLLDVVMSNVANSELADVWVVQQYQSFSLHPVLAHGRPWDLDRSQRGLRVINPQEGLGDDEDGMAHGNTDALYRFRQLVRDSGAEHVLVLSADHVYRLDYRDVVAAHLDADAECTLVTTTMNRDEASHHTLVHVEGREPGRVVRVEHKPDEASTTTVASEVFLYRVDALLAVLEHLHDALPDGERLGDFGEDLLPAMVERGATIAVELPGYWRDLGRPSAYLNAHHDLLDGTADVFDDPAWPMRTALPRRRSAHMAASAAMHDSLIGDGCDIAGEVERSVLGPGVVVEKGARVVDSVLMADVHIGAGARVGWSILDDGVRVGAGAQVGSPEHPSAPERLRSADVTMIGGGVAVPPDAVVSPGSRLSPDAVES